MKTNDFGPSKRLFFKFAHFHVGEPKLIPVSLLPAQEIEPPFRAGIALGFWIPILRRGLIVGIWGAELDEDDALLKATQGWGYDLDGADVTDPEIRDSIRKIVADHAEDMDDEWEIMESLGLASKDDL